VIRQRLQNVDDSLELVIVKDMMLIGYDSPPLHTLYLDRPLKGALLMQTLARVNRTFRGKQDGLLVAYAPLVENLEKALAEYTVQDRENKPIGRNVDEAVEHDTGERTDGGGGNAGCSVPQVLRPARPGERIVSVNRRSGRRAQRLA
jgi:type I site-specific restriction-modification system R (restriction) subunit